MANVKISELTASSTPLAGTEVLPIVQSGATVKVSVANLTAGRAITATSLNGLAVSQGAGSVATNTAVGTSALASNTTGAFNTAIGYQASNASTTGASNVIVGYQAGRSNIGDDNVAVGTEALQASTASSNTAIGRSSLVNNTTGSSGVAVGYQALAANTTGINNTAVGYQAAYSNTTGEITAFGRKAGYANTTATACVYVGDSSGFAATGSSNTFIGYDSGNAITTGAKNTIIGKYTGNQGGLDIRTASNYIVLSDGDGTPRIWHTNQGSFGYFVAPSIYNNTTGGAANVNVTSAGELYRSTSSIKYKRDVQNATHGLSEVLQLRPVTYKGKNNGDTVFGGLIAEEVHEAGLTEFVQYAEDGSPDALAYGNMVSLCVKAIQELKAEFDAYKASHP
jgi:hypothetical protein